MQIDLRQTLAAPIDACFGILADHEGYTRFRGISKAELIEVGQSDRNGVGAVRRLTSGRIWFDEEITAYERPRRLDYLIKQTNLPLNHQGGSIELDQIGTVTHVHWVSTFRATGAFHTAKGVVLATALRRGFVRMLEDTERLAQAGSPDAATR
jgi:uncharacterized protein YndB with AHSA1/START domain